MSGEEPEEDIVQKFREYWRRSKSSKGYQPREPEPSTETEEDQSGGVASSSSTISEADGSRTQGKLICSDIL